MKRVVMILLLAMSALGLGLAPAPALPGSESPGSESPGFESPGRVRSIDLYMVKDVEIWDANWFVEPPVVKRYSGWYYALRKTGSRVVGQRGFLHYETDDMCVTGTVTGRKAHLVGHRGGEEPYNFYETWLGAGATQHVKGYKSVTRGQLQVYMMGGDPRRLIDRCARR